MGCDRNCGLLSMAIIGAVLAFFGGALIPVGNYVIDKTIRKEAVIENGTIAYENWVVPGSPVYRQFWFFDVQNPAEVMENGSQPLVQQKGPYTYRLRYLPKENITQHNDSTVSFFLPNIVLFEPTLSIGPENDTITTVNLAVVAAPALYTSAFVQVLLNTWVKSSKSQFLQNRTVKEILWGYEDPFLTKIPFPIDRVVGVLVPFNNTLDGLYRIYNGKDDIRKVAIIKTYKNSRNLSFWDSYCDLVNGSDGASFPPFVKKEQILRFFSSDVCRSFYGFFDSDYTLKGIPVYRFVVPQSAFASPLQNPDNICFCPDRELSRNCSVSGAMDISKCQQGKPVVITLPHFLYASEDVMSGIQGLNPDRNEHMTFLDVEPTTGFTLHVAKRMQINLLVRPNNRITPLKKVQRPYIFPILWLNETALIGDDKAAFFRETVTNNIKLLHIAEAVLIVLGTVIFVVGFAAYITCLTKKEK